MTTLFEMAEQCPIPNEMDWGNVGELGKYGPSEAFTAYWRFAHERQEVFLRRLAGEAPPWTTDEVIARNRFTNVFRVADRVSQYLIHRVIARSSNTPEDIVFRTLLFKLFNRIETWEYLCETVGEPCWESYTVERFSEVLEIKLSRSERIFSSAYIMPTRASGFTAPRKHQNMLHLLDYMMRSGLTMKIAKAGSMRALFKELNSYPMLGPFLAYQFSIDINYTDLVDFSENEFVVAGPGALSGIAKCFGASTPRDSDDIIRLVMEGQDEFLACINLTPLRLEGRSLKLIDCQNLFCEIDKYTRVSLPHLGGIGSRTRIKHRFGPTGAPISYAPPSKWSSIIDF